MDSNAIIGFFNGTLPDNGKLLLSRIEPIISVVTQIELFCSNNISLEEIKQLQKFVGSLLSTVILMRILFLIQLRFENLIKLKHQML